MTAKAIYNHENKPFYSRLKSFDKWLRKQDYAKTSIRPFLNYVGCFLDYTERENLEINQVRYSDMLEFIKQCRKKDGIGLLNRKLGAVRKYYEWLQFSGEVEKNPASGIYLKGRRKGIPHDLLDGKTLERLYEHYQITDERSQRNKMILGLLIRQGLTNEELHKLEPKHIKLKSGEIEVPAGNKSNGRILKLEPEQIFELQQYIQIIRPEILAKICDHIGKKTFYRSGRKPDRIDKTGLKHQLFISMNGSCNIKPSIFWLIQALQQIDDKVKSAAQIRQSVITEWLKTKDLRTVQYMAGHRYVSTTERYMASNPAELTEAVNIHHPLQ